MVIPPCPFLVNVDLDTEPTMLTKADFFASCPIFISASRYEQVRTFRLWLLPILLKSISRWVSMSSLSTIQFVQRYQWYADKFTTLASLLHICGVHDLCEMLRLCLGGWHPFTALILN
jgi:hypothetical protein